MKILGIIAEYNPFHTGHLYHLEEAKKRTSPDLTIIVMSGYYVQRGEPAIIDPYIRARIAVDYGADLVISLPLVYTLESADYFAHGAITLLHEMGVTDLCFGSEDGTLETFTNIAYAIKEHEADYHQAIRQAMNAGNRYSEACNSALKQICGQEIRLPNDLLGLAYVKEVILNHLPITLHTIKRTSSYHALELTRFASAAALRQRLLAKEDVASYLPGYELYQNARYLTLDDFFPEIKYAILFHQNLCTIHLVDEGIEHLLKRIILDCQSLDELIDQLTSKRYTRVRIQRMLMHILLNHTKEDIKEAMVIDYILLLALSPQGRNYIKQAKQQTELPILTSINRHPSPALALERKGIKLLTLKDPDAYRRAYQGVPYLKQG